MVGLLPHRKLLEEVRQDVQKMLGYVGDENGVDLSNLEIYPATNHNFRLPYASDRITITDEWLNLPGQEALKPNLIKFMAYVRDKDRQAVPEATANSTLRGRKPRICWRIRRFFL
jgi:hypothetical protein